MKGISYVEYRNIDHYCRSERLDTDYLLYCIMQHGKTGRKKIWRKTK
ncbi:protein of unknown function [Petrocella atlantisensis]|uniref:Uncharacterized protein n=1 Tax=Petrocella atlantisensis TaxID=2173034 RepID=A0A3P7P3A9_9FIRM|nr:hypothetical protein [Petrocella atlantisensis]MCF8020554.1 hypothetical protein [Vallitaleaceae bacterium]VDN48020.1 protein of unknown function [Petrocella atlantisensis]